jgi:hypothetical protein
MFAWLLATPLLLSSHGIFRRLTGRKTQDDHNLNVCVLVWLCDDRTCDLGDSFWSEANLIPELRVVTVALTLHRLPICQPEALERQPTNFSSLHPGSTRIPDFDVEQHYIRRTSRARKYSRIDLIKSETYLDTLMSTRRECESKGICWPKHGFHPSRSRHPWSIGP